MDYMAVIVSMLAIFTPPPNLSLYTDLPSSVSWGLEAVAISGVGGVPAYMSALNAGISMGLGEMPITEYTWFSSQRDGAYSFLPEILSLGGGIISLDMTSASEMASALSALSASEAYLSTQVFTSVTTALSTTINTAVITSQVAGPGSAKKGLSTGEKIGLGIGIPAFIILLLLVGFIVFHVRRNRYLENENAVFVPPAPHQIQSTRSVNSNGRVPGPEPDTGLSSSQEMTENVQEQAESGPQTPLPNTRRQTRQWRPRPHSLADIDSLAHQQSKPRSRRTLSTGGIPISSGSEVEQLSRNYRQRGANVGLVQRETARGNEAATDLPATPIHVSTSPTLGSVERLRARLGDREKLAMRPIERERARREGP
jgi:hypothetical protein